MKSAILRACTLALAAALAGCASITGGGTTPVDVTRFHLNQPISRSSIAVVPAEPADANAPNFAAYRAAVERQLARLGWVVAPSASGTEQVALIDVEQGSREGLSRGGFVRPGAILPPSASPDVVSTLLQVSLRRRSDASVFWEGRAQAEARARSQEANPAIAVERLAQALFRDFPGESGRTISVE